MKKAKCILAVLFVVILVAMEGLTVIAADATTEQTAPNETTSYQVEVKHEIILDTENLGPEFGNARNWSSSDEKIATVDNSGTVYGEKVGHATITVTDEITKASAEYEVDVTGESTWYKRWMTDHALASYMYSPVYDYYYTNDKECWQQVFGFNFGYDMGSKLILLDYDYVRAFFTYEGKDWMIQMWKGQYGLIFFGDEIGVYTKPENKSTASAYAHYSSASKNDYMFMQNELRHEMKDGSYETVFVRPRNLYWWCTGFSAGHLRKTAPCKELLAISTIELKDAEMARLFAEALLDMGQQSFKQVENKEALTPDTFCIDPDHPNIVHLQWQYKTDARNKNPLQDAGAKSVAAVGVTIIILSMFVYFLLTIAFGWIGLIGTIKL